MDGRVELTPTGMGRAAGRTGLEASGKLDSHFGLAELKISIRHLSRDVE